MSAYTELFNSGYAHSVEAWKDDELVGGIYGVLVDGVFSAESMFFTESYASKICLLQMIEWLKSQGLKWMDIQMVTPHMKSMGGIELSREEFLNLLKKSQKDFKAYTET
jgi:leucyl/phenylalanyl-tRNA--protein transferase